MDITTAKPTYLLRCPGAVVDFGVDCVAPSLGTLIPGSSPYVRGDYGPFGTVAFDGIVESFVLRCRPSSFIDRCCCLAKPSLAAVLICTAWNVSGYLMPD